MTDQPSAATDAADTAKPAGTAPTAKIRGALLRYRVLAWITGVWLLMLVAQMIARYGFDDERFVWVGFAHGWIYFIYLIFTVDLSIKVRWPLGKLVATAIAGTIPFLSFYFEHVRTREVKEQFGV